MPIVNPTELHKFLNENNIRAKKSLSQNFLIDANIVNKIVAAASISSGDTVLEVGPGPGALTEQLLETKAHVIAVEKDSFFAEKLSRLPEVKIFQEDILTFDVKNNVPDGSKVVANLPYSLTTNILQRFLPLHGQIKELVVMVQDEFARRITASPGNKDYGSFTVFTNFYSKPKYLFKISPSCFYPQPKVSSAIISLKLHAPPQIPHEDFFKLTRTAFGQRRKMMRSTLKNDYPAITSALEKLNLNPEARPESLSLQNFIDLFLELCD
jgi:16S rRNA (adenine1518-N6/adenine1519-N6)-dimethyltransferase